jgi:hypothetical protein
MTVVRYRNYQEFLAAWKARVDLDQTSPFYQAMLETLEEAAAKERQGQHTDPGTILSTSIKKVQVVARATGPIVDSAGLKEAT